MPDRCLHRDCDCPTRQEAERDAQYDRDPEPDDRPWVLPEWMRALTEAEDRQERAVEDADDARADQDWGWEE